MKRKTEAERQREYAALRQEIDRPIQLSGSVARAQERAQKRNGRTKWLRRMLGIPACAVVAAFLALTVAVNASPALAYSVAQVPGLKALARAVAASPSLKAAVDNRYVQPVAQSMSNQGITVTVEYVIVDKKNINVFYTLDAEEWPQKGLSVDFAMHNDSRLNLFHGENAIENNSFQGGLHRFSVSYSSANALDNLILEFKVKEQAIWFLGDEESYEDFLERAQGQDYLSSFIFNLKFDPNMVDTGKMIPIGEWVDLDGQKLYVDSLEVYPSESVLKLGDSPDNSAWLRDLYFYMQDGAGNVYRRKQGFNYAGESGEGSDHFVGHYPLASSYFGTDEDYTVYLEGALWLDKAREYAKIDFVHSSWNMYLPKTDFMPEGSRLASATARPGYSWEIWLEKDVGVAGGRHSPFTGRYKSPEGEEGYSYLITTFNQNPSEGRALPTGMIYELKDYPDKTVYMQRDYTHETDLFSAPIALPVASAK